jgi:hypothetical protein
MKIDPPLFKIDGSGLLQVQMNWTTGARIRIRELLYGIKVGRPPHLALPGASPLELIGLKFKTLHTQYVQTCAAYTEPVLKTKIA